jgi:hypothetical protein
VGRGLPHTSRLARLKILAPAAQTIFIAEDEVFLTIEREFEI